MDSFLRYDGAELEDMEKHGHGYIKAGLDEEKRKKIEDLSMEAKARMKRYKEAEANIFDPQKATPEQLEAYAAQKQYPFVPNERTRIIFFKFMPQHKIIYVCFVAIKRLKFCSNIFISKPTKL